MQGRPIKVFTNNFLFNFRLHISIMVLNLVDLLYDFFIFISMFGRK